MYIRPETRAAHDRYWQEIKTQLAGMGFTQPVSFINNPDLPDHWLSPDLILSQTCGRPYRLKLHGKTSLIGTPDYGLPDCPAGYYRSAFIVRANDTRPTTDAFSSATFAYNEKLSQSGWAAPQCHVAPLGFQFTNLLETGGHRNSAIAVAKGRADIAALDAVTWNFIKKYDGFATDLRVLEWTTPTPGLPYITAQANDPDNLFTAVAQAIETLPQTDRETLCLKGIVQISAQAYLAVPNP